MCNDKSMNCGCSSDNNKCKIGPFVAADATCSPAPSVTSGIPIIPFSSGTDRTTLITDTEGLPVFISFIGFGSSINGFGAPIGDSDIDLSDGTTEAFSAPRAGYITAISASFTAVTITPDSETTVRARIYRAAADSTIFSPTNAFVDLTPISTTVTVARGLKNLSSSVPFEPGDLLLMVFSSTASGSSSLLGNSMAGITIA